MIAIEEFRLRNNQVKENLAKRANGAEMLVIVDKIVTLDKECTGLLNQIEIIRSQRNKKSDEVGKLMTKGDNTTGAAISKEVSELKERIAGLETIYRDKEKELRDLLSGLPNLLHASVPAGVDSNDNPVVREWGNPEIGRAHV